jgi:hypothetical protein
MSKKRRSPASFNTYDAAFKPLYPYGDNGKPVSAEHLIHRRMYKEVLDGSRPAIAVFLRMVRAREDARPKECVTDLPLVIEGTPDPVWRPTPAMLLLAVVSVAAAESEPRLEPWAAHLALSRDGAPLWTDHDRKQIERYTRDPALPEPAPFRLPPVEPPQRRSPEETRFKKGKSGNPGGRPKKGKLDLPVTGYFDEVGTVRINGKEHQMTRMQHLLHVLQMKAIKGDASMTARLAGNNLQVRLAQYKHRQRQTDEDLGYDFDQDLPPRHMSDPFVQMLRKFRIANRRTKTRVLLEPWVVEAALARFGERRLTLAEQAEVLRSTSKPASVAWPQWWEIRSHAAAKPYPRQAAKRR